MAYAITSPLPVYAGQWGEPVDLDMCTSCEAYDCEACPELDTRGRCCCGDLSAEMAQ